MRHRVRDVSAGQFSDLAEQVAEDLVFELPYGPDFIPNPVEGRDAWNQMQHMTFKLFTSFALELVGSTTASTRTS